MKQIDDGGKKLTTDDVDAEFGHSPRYWYAILSVAMQNQEYAEVVIQKILNFGQKPKSFTVNEIAKIIDNTYEPWETVDALAGAGVFNLIKAEQQTNQTEDAE